MSKKRKSSLKENNASKERKTRPPKTKKLLNTSMTRFLDSLIAWLRENGGVINNVEERNTPGTSSSKGISLTGRRGKRIIRFFFD